MAQDMREPNVATKRLWLLTRQRHQAEVNELADIAFQADGLSPNDGWRFDLSNGMFVRELAES